MSKEKKPAEIAIPPGEIFEAATLTWNGKEHEVPPRRIMGLIAAIERGDPAIDFPGLTFHELVQMSLGGRVELTALANAWYCALRYAGFRDITNQQVYAGMFNGGLAPDLLAEAISSLLALMVPPENVRKSVLFAMGGRLKVDMGKDHAPAMPQ